jgi:dextranase
MIDSANKIEVIPDKAQFRPEDKLTFKLRCTGDHFLGNEMYSWSVLDENKLVAHGGGRLTLTSSRVEEITINVPAISDGSGAYGMFVTVCQSEDGAIYAETAFDVAEHWREAPRYGFLSDFSPEEAGRLDDVEFLNRHHINLVQFYDWMYRHDQLLADSQEFIDPLGRCISHKVVSEKIAAFREHGIASMAYAAIYGSLPDYAHQYPEQLLYQNDGRPHSLGNFFHIMDISEDSAWTKHIINEFVNAIQVMGFDGLQLDQYGFPKKAIRKKDGKHEIVALKDLYPRFIDLVREAVSERIGNDVVLIYNNVGNYPTHTTAISELDTMYIEVWDPAFHLRDLKQIIDNARLRSGKQVVIAAYLHAFHPEKPSIPAQAEIGAIIAMATIFASGGYHILLGEHENLLADSYFPKYGSLSESFKVTMQHYYDFIVMYRNLLYDLELDDVSMTFAGGINTEVVFSKEGVSFAPNGDLDTVWTTVKEKPGLMVIHLINLNGLDNDVWAHAKEQVPVVIENIEIKVESWEAVEGIYCATPDGNSIRSQEIDYEFVPKGNEGGQFIRFTVPRLDYWTMVYMKTKSGVPAETFDMHTFPGARSLEL